MHGRESGGNSIINKFKDEANRYREDFRKRILSAAAADSRITSAFNGNAGANSASKVDPKGKGKGKATPQGLGVVAEGTIASSMRKRQRTPSSNVEGENMQAKRRTRRSTKRYAVHLVLV